MNSVSPVDEQTSFVWMIVQNMTYVNNAGVSAIGCGLLKVMCDENVSETVEKIYTTCKDAITHIRIWKGHHDK